MAYSDQKKLRLAVMGTRGIPAAYGGFETFAEELSNRLVARGHSVTVYGRSFFSDKKPFVTTQMIGGVRSILTKTIKHKYLETPLHALTSAIDLFCRRRDFDVVLLCNAANSPFAWIIKAAGLPLAINVDGIERNRSKWNALGRLWYRLGEWCSTIFATVVVSDAEVIHAYYEERYGVSSTMIPYGASAVRVPADQTLSDFQLTPSRYILYVSRLEPENNALGVIEAYRLSRLSEANIPLVVVGDAPYADAYKAQLRSASAGINVIFTGFQFGHRYHELRSHCLLYVQATEVGGTHPALVEALAYGNPTIANGTPENTEVLNDCGLIYEKNDFVQLSQLMNLLFTDKALRESLSKKARLHAATTYSWDAVTMQYESLCYEMKNSKSTIF